MAFSLATAIRASACEKIKSRGDVPIKIPLLTNLFSQKKADLPQKRLIFENFRILVGCHSSSPLARMLMSSSTKMKTKDRDQKLSTSISCRRNFFFAHLKTTSKYSIQYSIERLPRPLHLTSRFFPIQE